MSERPNPFEMVFSNEEIEQLFKNFPTENSSYNSMTGRETDTVFSSRWRAESEMKENELLITLRKGDSSIDFGHRERYDYLRWNALIPEALVPDMTASQFIGSFESLIFEKLYRNTGMPVQKRVDLSASEIILGYPDGENKYRTGIRSEYLDFMLEFCRPEYDVDSLLFSARRPGNTMPDYIAHVHYGERIVDAGMMTLVFPEHMRKYRPWNEQTMRFALDTHREKTGDVDLKEAKHLTELIDGELKESTS